MSVSSLGSSRPDLRATVEHRIQEERDLQAAFRSRPPLAVVYQLPIIGVEESVHFNTPKPKGVRNDTYGGEGHRRRGHDRR